MQGSSPAYFTEYESVSVFQSVYQKSLKSQLFPLSVSSLLSPGQTGRVMANKCSGCICVLPTPPPPPPPPPTSPTSLATSPPPPPQGEGERERDEL